MKKSLLKKLLSLLFLNFVFFVGQTCYAFSLYTANSYEDFLKIFAYNFEQRESNFAIKLLYPASPISEARKALEDLKCLQPYDYWHYQNSIFNSYSDTVTVQVNYRTTHEQEEDLLSNLKDLSENWKNLPLLERIKAVHDWVINHTEYDLSFSRYTAYEAFFEGLAVCQGYTLLTYRLLSLLKVDSGIVEGFGQNQDHLWNMVKICCQNNCQWFHLDVTWDDPLPGGLLRYDYFLLSDEEISRDHIIYDSCGHEASQNFEEWLSQCETPISLIQVKTNGQNDHLVFHESDLIKVSISLESIVSIPQADYFFWVQMSDKICFCYRLPGIWEICPCDMPSPTYQGPIFQFYDLSILEIPCIDLPKGSYKIFFAVDTEKNGVLDKSAAKAEVTFEIQ